MIRIRPDPDPKHCLKETLGNGVSLNLLCVLDKGSGGCTYKTMSWLAYISIDALTVASCVELVSKRHF